MTLRRFYEDLLGWVRALPGVESAAIVTRHPLWSTQGYDWPFTIEGQPDQERGCAKTVALMRLATLCDASSTVMTAAPPMKFRRSAFS